jgi:hypothetical protein
MDRRQFSIAMAAFALARPTVTKAAAAPVVFTIYSMRTAWHPIPAIGDWPLDHVAVATSSGSQWGCFGRTQAEEASTAKPIVKASGDELWAREIAGKDGHAGIDFGVTGICHHCANRIALPANIDSRDAPGNEIATPIFGRYGLDRDALIRRIKDAALAVNREHPRRISERSVSEVISRIGGGLKDEWSIVRADIERIIRPVLGASYDSLKGDIEQVYLGLYYKREALHSAYSRGKIEKARFVDRMNSGFSSTLEDLKDVVGAAEFAKIVPVPVPYAAAYVFYKLPLGAR